MTSPLARCRQLTVRGPRCMDRRGLRFGAFPSSLVHRDDDFPPRPRQAQPSNGLIWAGSGSSPGPGKREMTRLSGPGSNLIVPQCVRVPGRSN